MFAKRPKKIPFFSAENNRRYTVRLKGLQGSDRQQMPPHPQDRICCIIYKLFHPWEWLASKLSLQYFPELNIKVTGIKEMIIN